MILKQIIIIIIIIIINIIIIIVIIIIIIIIIIDIIIMIIIIMIISIITDQCWRRVFPETLNVFEPSLPRYMVTEIGRDFADEQRYNLLAVTTKNLLLSVFLKQY